MAGRRDRHDGVLPVGDGATHPALLGVEIQDVPVRPSLVEVYQRCIVASRHIDNLSFERVLDGSVLRCFTHYPVPHDDLLRVLDAGDGAR